MTAQLAYTVDEAAQASATSKATIHRAIAAGELTVRYVGPKKSKIVILAEELTAWLHALPETRGTK